MRKIIRIILVIGMIICVIMIGYFLLKDNYFFQFELNGPEYVVYNLGDNYVEMGVILKENGQDYSQNVIIENNIDINNIGNYTVKYRYKDKELIRYVEVKVLNSMSLNGDEEVYLLLNGKYDDPKVNLIYEGKQLQDNIEIDSNFDASKVGDYQITYSSDLVKKTVTRNIHVSEFDDYFKISYNKDISKDVILNIEIDKQKVLKYLLPDGSEQHDNYSFNVTKNGEYSFVVFDNYNNQLIKKIVIDNIGHLELHLIKAGGFYDDAILIRTPKTTLFIDGGQGEGVIVNYLNALHIKKFDYVIGSHTEFNHVQTHGTIINNFQVDKLMYANDIRNCDCRCDYKDVGRILEALEKKNVPIYIPEVPSVLTINDVTLYIIAPWSLGCSKNENSLVFILKYGDNTFMFTGDSVGTFSNANELFNKAKQIGLNSLKVDVLKFPHHGNADISEATLNLIRPDIIIVPNNGYSYSVPYTSVLNKIKKYGNGSIYRLKDSNTESIVLTSDGKTINVKMNANVNDYVT